MKHLDLTVPVLVFREKLLQLTSFHEDFREALPYWLNKAFSTTMERVEKAVQVDQVNLESFTTGSMYLCSSCSYG